MHDDSRQQQQQQQIIVRIIIIQFKPFIVSLDNNKQAITDEDQKCVKTQK
jgi:hypothetical protein